MEFVSDEQRKAVFANLNKGSGDSNKREKSTNKKQTQKEDFYLENQETIKTISKVITTITPIIFPQTQLFFTGYNVGKQLYKAFNQIQDRDSISKTEIKNLVINGASETTSRISEPIAESIAQEIKKYAKSSGIIQKISDETKVNKDTYSSMLEGTIKEQMLSGVKNLTNYALEGINI